MANINGGVIGVDNEPVVVAEQITTFNSSGTLTTQPHTTSLDFLVVAGGGAGGGNPNGNGCGGGGAGGLTETTGHPVSSNSPYPIVVGGGGAASNVQPVRAPQGSNSSAFSTTTKLAKAAD